MSNVVIGGVTYDCEALAEQAGLHPDTIKSRAYKHPEWSLEEVIKPNKRKLKLVTHDGVTMPLGSWARLLGANYHACVYRWKLGIRDFDSLMNGWNRDEVSQDQGLSLSKESIDFLKATRYARAGQKDEWIIACDLAGVSRSYAEELKGMLA